MSVKEFLESEIKKHLGIIKKLGWFDKEISRREDLIMVIRVANKASVGNFHYDRGFYFSWFKDRQIKEKISVSIGRISKILGKNGKVRYSRSLD